MAAALPCSGYLLARGVLTGDVGNARVTKLTGGVSGEVTLVETGTRRVVLKRALPIDGGLLAG